jgi:hypothetical protein
VCGPSVSVVVLHDQVPAGSTVAVQTVLPSSSLSTMVLPATPVPVMAGVLSLLCTGVVGLAGLRLVVVITGAAGTADTVGLPAGSVVVTGIGVDGLIGAVVVQTTIPLADAGVGTQVDPGIVTVAPGSTPVQVIWLGPVTLQTGALGATVSILITPRLDGADVLPVGVV